MQYTSTRNGNIRVNAAQAVIEGLCADGGLYVPVEFPALEWKDFLPLSYAARAQKVLEAFFDFDIGGVAEKAYSVFDGDPAPVVKIDDDKFVLELWHGKTCAFKDMALSVLPHLLAAAKKTENVKTNTLILVATSGDTGKAALEGFRDADGVSVCVFYPTDGVSLVQKLSMQTQLGDNVNVAGIAGNFDDAQTAVKTAFRDDALKIALKANNTELSSANSINIGRLVPQIAYYYSAYCDLVNSGEIAIGSTVDFAVPTGNFGNILAGYYAKRMGLPIGRLICASNRNNVLYDFIKTGVYDANRKFYETLSPSMDILISSNLERMLFELSGRDSSVNVSRMNNLKETGRFEITAEERDKLNGIFATGYTDDCGALDAIADAFDEYGYLFDTHTAAAYEYVRGGTSAPTVIVSTANPFKFAPSVLSAIEHAGLAGAKRASTPELFDKLSELTAFDAPESLAEVFGLAIRFDKTISPKEIIPFIANRYGA